MDFVKDQLKHALGGGPWTEDAVNALFVAILLIGTVLVLSYVATDIVAMAEHMRSMGWRAGRVTVSLSIMAIMCVQAWTAYARIDSRAAPALEKLQSSHSLAEMAWSNMARWPTKINLWPTWLRL